MIRIDFMLEIACPPEKVFARLVDLESLPEWQSTAVSAEADGPLAEGVVIHERRNVFGRELENELEVVAFEPPQRLGLQARKGPVPFGVDHRLAGNEGGTVLQVVAEAEPGTFMKLAEPLLARQAEQELRADFERLKELLEAERA